MPTRMPQAMRRYGGARSWSGLRRRASVSVLMLAPLIGMLLRAPGVGFLMLLGGFLSLGLSVLVHAVTLPTEWDASFNRALPILSEGRYLKPGDEKHARRLLAAAACTYVAASLMSLLSVARWWAILRR